MNSLLATLALTTALTLPGLALARPVTVTAALDDYGGEGAYLAVSTGDEVDMEAVTYRMHKLVDRLGKELSSPARLDTGSRA